MSDTLTIKTQNRYELIDITGQVEEIISKSKVGDGLCLIFLPHSTAAIILTENEQRLERDWLAFLERLVGGLDFEHDQIDDNADSHILSGLLGQQKILPIEHGKLLRGTWQQIFLAELDGPRTRSVGVRVIRG